MQVLWSPADINDLEAIGDYVARDKPDASLKLVRRLFVSVEALAAMPERGRRGRIEGTRELVIPPYIVVYELDEDRLHILHIYHAAQDWPVPGPP